MSLWGTEFELPNSTKQVKKIASKIKSPKEPKVVTEKVAKSKSIDLATKLSIISKEVDRVLGSFKSNTQVIRDKQEFIDYIDASISNGIIAIDTETNNSLDPITCKLMGACIYTPGQKNAYIPVNHINRVTNQLLENQLTEQDIKEQFDRLSNTKIVMHNGKFDYEVIKCTCNCELQIYWDSEIAARVLNENEKAALKTQYVTHIDSNQEKYDIEHLFEGLPYEVVDPDVFALYAATDPYITYKLYEWQLKQFQAPGNEKLYSVFRNVEMPSIQVVAEMELTGVAIDEPYAERLSKKYHKQLDIIDDEIYQELSVYKDKIAAWRKTDEANFKEKNSKPNKNGEYTYKKSKNEQLADPIEVSSPTQLAILLYDILKVEPPDKKNPRGTGVEILEQIELPICKTILKKRGLEKLLGTFIDALPTYRCPKDNRIHPNFRQIGADTGRMSCNSPNLQQIPSGMKNIRLMFKAKEEIEKVKTQSDSFIVNKYNEIKLVNKDEWKKPLDLEKNDVFICKNEYSKDVACVVQSVKELENNQVEIKFIIWVREITDHAVY